MQHDSSSTVGGEAGKGGLGTADGHHRHKCLGGGGEVLGEWTGWESLRAPTVFFIASASDELGHKLLYPLYLIRRIVTS